MSSDEMHEIMTTILPSINVNKRRALIDGLCAYHAKFAEYRCDRINPETSEDYLNEQFELAVVDQDDFWVYSPYFSKAMGLVLNKLFKTKIMYMGLYECVRYDREIVYIDKDMHRWMVRFLPVETEKLRICMRMPRSGSLLQKARAFDTSQVLDPVNPAIISVVETNAWYE